MLLAFKHPCGIEYELVAAKNDSRQPYSTGVVPKEYGIRGTHGIAVSVCDGENSDEFMQVGWNGRKRATDGNYVRYEVGAGGSGPNHRGFWSMSPTRCWGRPCRFRRSLRTGVRSCWRRSSR
jgi:hypothetical protein